MANLTGNQVCYRIGSSADAVCTGVLATQVFLDTYATDGIRADLAREVLDAYSPGAFLLRLEDPDITIMLAEKAGHLVGFAEYADSLSCPVAPVPTRGELVRLYILRQFQRSGIGQHLLRLTESIALERGRQRLWLSAWEGNCNACAFYLANGYREIGLDAHTIEGKAYTNRVFLKELGPDHS